MTMFADDEIELLNSEIYALEQKLEQYRLRIMVLGEWANACVYDDLKQVCDYCQCKRKKTV
jgi:hypothetical protein